MQGADSDISQQFSASKRFGKEIKKRQDKQTKKSWIEHRAFSRRQEACIWKTKHSEKKEAGPQSLFRLQKQN